MPSNVVLPPVWILGSSRATASLAASLGTGYSFASHFSSTSPLPALRTYRQTFQPSAQFPQPHVILGAAVMCAETDEEAEYLALPMDLVWVRLHRGEFGPIPSPEEALAYPYTDQDRAVIASRRALQVVGSPATVRLRLTALAEETGADEIMIATTTYNANDRLRSYELVAEAFAPDSSRLLLRPPSTTIAAHS
ncbi:MAG TPA: MsnO8 family LLM class oxidoreductase [Thermoanaerobaculia bacterium]|nr:MsnO8 family LLM class oxidoreductase [Thermoanaerobaculia bacterium]